MQLFTAMVYEGPLLARRIARGLARLLERDGFKSVADAVGVDVRSILSAVIPGRVRKHASPKSILRSSGYGFRVRAFWRAPE